MNVGELIAYLQTLPPEMKVLRRQRNGFGYQGPEKWDTMDGHWWQKPLVKPSDGVLNNGLYYEAVYMEAGAEEVLEL